MASTTTNFDPYKILQIENDGSFNTKEIKAAYIALAEKYRPDKVDSAIVSQGRARYRFDRLKKAHQTLTRRDKYDNWISYGDPDGSKAM